MVSLIKTKCIWLGGIPASLTLLSLYDIIQTLIL